MLKLQNLDCRTKYVFVCGLHRSGTTVLGRAIGRLENCTCFEKTGAVMDEGQFLQDVYPTDEVYGGAGSFGFAPQAHLTETSSLLNAANISRLREKWNRYWDAGKPIKIEKTPSNLLMTRFLQTAFANSYFIVIKRHPVPVSLATQKWSMTPIHKLFEHWLRCYEIFENDKKYLNYVHELTYEEFVRDPTKHLNDIAAFLGTQFSGQIEERVSSAHNNRYFDRWSRMLKGPCQAYYCHAAWVFEKRFGKYGYSLISSVERNLSPLSLESERAPIRRFVGQSLCVGANICCFVWRAGAALRSRLKRMLFGLTPNLIGPLLNKRTEV